MLHHNVNHEGYYLSLSVVRHPEVFCAWVLILLTALQGWCSCSMLDEELEVLWRTPRVTEHHIHPHVAGCKPCCILSTQPEWGMDSLADDSLPTMLHEEKQGLL